MKQTGYKCNRVEGTSRCQKRIKSGKCPSADKSLDCCGRIISSEGEVTQPDSVFADLRKEVIV